MAEFPMSAGLAIAPPSTPIPKIRPKTASLRVDADEVADHVIATLQDDITARAEWLELRKLRYAKYRGWLENDLGPWPDAINPQVPLILWNCLRLQAQLHNAILSTRPVMVSQAWKKHDVAKQEVIDQLQDWQVFIEADGAKKLDAFIQGFVEDGNTVMHIPWIRETRTIHDVRVFPPADQGFPDAGLPPGPEVPYVAALLQTIFPQAEITSKSQTDLVFRVQTTDPETNAPVTATATVAAREDGRLEVHIERPVTVYNGPMLHPEDLEDIVLPMRCANLQPRCPSNPRGAKHVRRVARVSLDDIRRRVKDGTYDLLTMADVEEFSALAQTRHSADQITQHIESPKIQKDDIEGAADAGGDSDDELTMIESYDRWDVNGDGLEEDVIFWVLQEPKRLARARFLTEQYPPAPGLLPRRPFAETCLIPVRNRWYGIGMIELLEHVSDLFNAAFRMNFAWGEVGNSPFFFYDPGSGLKQDVIRLYPGEGYPVPNPRENVYFPSLPSRDQAWAFNMGTILQGVAERLSMQSGVQYGQVPQGKATALRNVGTTMALIQQSDIRADQILLRLFEGLKEIWAQIHSLNQRYLPPGKAYRVVGVPTSSADAFRTATGPESVSGRYDFAWKATLLSADKNLLSQILLEIVSVIISPLTFQTGIVDAEKAYKLLRKYITSRHQDADEFLNRPPQTTEAPRILAEEAISAALSGQAPVGIPLEPPQEHLQKLLAFVQGPQMELLDAVGRKLLEKHLALVRGQLMEDARKQQMMQAVAQFQQAAMQGGGGGPLAGMMTAGSVPGLGDMPQVESGEHLQEDLVGSGGGQGG